MFLQKGGKGFRPFDTPQTETSATKICTKLLAFEKSPKNQGNTMFILANLFDMENVNAFTSDTSKLLSYTVHPKRET